MLKRIKAKLRKAWRKIKLWFVAVLVSLGVFVAMPTEAEVKTFNWINPTQYVDGTALDSADIEEIRIYCDADPVPVIVSLADATTADSNFAVGEHTCTATAVVGGIESERSNAVTFEVLPVASAAPSGFEVS